MPDEDDGGRLGSKCVSELDIRTQSKYALLTSLSDRTRVNSRPNLSAIVAVVTREALTNQSEL